MVVTIIVFVLVFGVVVIAHELGHFLIAKLNGIKVLQFSIGMGPDIIKFTKGETKYVLKLLPIGGACMFEGEDGIYSTNQNGDDQNGQKPEGAFNDANVWSRIATVFAGPFFNLILAFLLSLIVVGFSGETIPTINTLTEGYPAEAAGLRECDIITKIDGDRIYLQGEVTFASALSG
ncbi:MAG: site-2 protease family protein, partial [Lachnospiraceae bacterium]|nr:site-2 protease family protein [Lachnospiraceae bacterium]